MGRVEGRVRRLDDVEKDASCVGLLVLVRVELEGEPPVRLADLRRGGTRAQTERLVPGSG